MRPPIEQSSAIVLHYLLSHPQGLSLQEVMHGLGFTFKRTRLCLYWLDSKGLARYVRKPRSVTWFAAVKPSEVPEELREVPEYKAEECRRWPSGGRWTPPQPRVPSVWHYAAGVSV